MLPLNCLHSSSQQSLQTSHLRISYEFPYCFPLEHSLEQVHILSLITESQSLVKMVSATTSTLLIAGTVLTLIQPCPAPVVAAGIAAGAGIATAAGTAVIAGASVAQAAQKRDLDSFSGGVQTTGQAQIIIASDGTMQVSGLSGTGIEDVVNKWNSYPNITALEAAYGKVAMVDTDSLMIWDYPAVMADFVMWGLPDASAPLSSGESSTPPFFFNPGPFRSDNADQVPRITRVNGPDAAVTDAVTGPTGRFNAAARKA